MISGTPPTAVAITGVPTARASTTVCGKFSQLELSTAASAPAKRRSTSARSPPPRNRTRSPSPKSRGLGLEPFAFGPVSEKREGHGRNRGDSLEQNPEVLLRGEPAGERERKRLAGGGSTALSVAERQLAEGGGRVGQHRDMALVETPAESDAAEVGTGDEDMRCAAQRRRPCDPKRADACVSLPLLKGLERAGEGT